MKKVWQRNWKKKIHWPILLGSYSLYLLLIYSL